MISTQTPPRAAGERLAGGLVATLRDALGRAHYERMRSGMAPDLLIDPWEHLSPGVREAYRQCLDYVLPDLLPVMGAVVREAEDELHAELLDSGVLS